MVEYTKQRSISARIINLPDLVADGHENDAFCRAYRFGHRDARHAAAEIASEVEARLEVAERMAHELRRATKKWAEAERRLATAERMAQMLRDLSCHVRGDGFHLLPDWARRDAAGVLSEWEALK